MKYLNFSIFIKINLSCRATWIDKNLEQVIKHFLYHQNPSARLITILGLCKLLLANKISHPEHFICRMIVVLYKSFEYTDPKREDFHIKIYEIMSSFVYFYANSGKVQNKSLLNSILIIFLSQIIGQSNFDFKSVFTEFQETKLEFINQFLKMICESSQDVKKPRKVLLRIFKFVYFLAEFVHKEDDIEEIDKNKYENNLNISQISKKNSRKGNNSTENKIIKNENLMDIVDNNNNQENENESKDENSENIVNSKEKNNYSFNKSKIPIKTLQNIKNNIKKFLDKTKYDAQLFSDLTDEKILKVLTMLNNCNLIGYFSNDMQEQYDELKENDFIIFRNGLEFDLKDQLKNFDDYVSKKREKYFNLIASFFAFQDIVKKECIGTILEEKSILADESQESILNTGLGNNISNIIPKIPNENLQNLRLSNNQIKNNIEEENNYSYKEKNNLEGKEQKNQHIKEEKKKPVNSNNQVIMKNNKEEKKGNCENKKNIEIKKSL